VSVSYPAKAIYKKHEHQ